MDVIFRLMNLLVPVIFLGVGVLAFVIAWRSMKALESISKTVKKYQAQSSPPGTQEH